MDESKERSILRPWRKPLRKGSLHRPDVESVSSATCVCICKPSSNSGRGTADNKYLISYRTYMARRNDCWFRLRSKDKSPSAYIKYFQLDYRGRTTRHVFDVQGLPKFFRRSISPRKHRNNAAKAPWWPIKYWASVGTVNNCTESDVTLCEWSWSSEMKSDINRP